MEYTDVITGLIAALTAGLGIFFGSWLYTRRTGVIMLFFLAWSICIDHVRIFWQQWISSASGYGTDGYVLTKTIVLLGIIYISYLVVKGQFTKSMKQNITCEEEYNKIQGHTTKDR